MKGKRELSKRSLLCRHGGCLEVSGIPLILHRHFTRWTCCFIFLRRPCATGFYSMQAPALAKKRRSIDRLILIAALKSAGIRFYPKASSFIGVVNAFITSTHVYHQFNDWQFRWNERASNILILVQDFPSLTRLSETKFYIPEFRLNGTWNPVWYAITSVSEHPRLVLMKRRETFRGFPTSPFSLLPLQRSLYPSTGFPSAYFPCRSYCPFHKGWAIKVNNKGIVCFFCFKFICENLDISSLKGLIGQTKLTGGLCLASKVLGKIQTFLVISNNI